MSHHSVYKTDIRINEDTLVKAITRLADKIGAKIRDYVYDAYGRMTGVSIALYSPDLPRGIGFNVVDGKLTVEGDNWGVEDRFEKYSELAKNFINSYITMKRVYKLYPNARVKTRLRDKIVEMEVIL